MHLSLFILFGGLLAFAQSEIKGGESDIIFVASLRLRSLFRQEPFPLRLNGELRGLFPMVFAFLYAYSFKSQPLPVNAKIARVHVVGQQEAKS